MTTYADIRTREDAEAFVAQMFSTPSGRTRPEAVRAALREDATDEWRRANGSPLADAPARSVGASLVILALNIAEGVQR